MIIYDSWIKLHSLQQHFLTQNHITNDFILNLSLTWRVVYRASPTAQRNSSDAK